ncbi:putative nicotinate-nucleotide adenylyltransferase [Gammaproteobacteria bacterium]
MFNKPFIGIQGGTFDPIHIGHLRTALELKEGLGLSEVRLIPARISPHRREPFASPQDRLDMLAAALPGNSGLVIDERELRRSGPSFTVDTLISLRAEVGETIPLCLLLGMDAFLGLHTWHKPRTILTLAHIVVAHRPGWAPPHSGLMADWLREYQGGGLAALTRQPAGIVLTYPVTALDISASTIRRLIAAGCSPRFLVPDAVCALIQQRSLYSSNFLAGLRPPPSGGLVKLDNDA